MDTLVDWFGKDFKIIKSDDKEITISVKCNERALMYWALQYGPYVEVIAPETLRNNITKIIDDMSKKYHK